VGETAPVVSARALGVEADCFREVGDRVQEFSLDETGMAAADKKRGAVGHEAKSLAVVGNGARDIAQHQSGPAPAGMARGIAGPKLDGLGEVRNRFGRCAGIGASIAAIAVGHGLVVRAECGACDDFRACTQSHLGVAAPAAVDKRVRHGLARRDSHGKRCKCNSPHRSPADADASTPDADLSA
jgi:hypothetical protein